LSCTKNLNPRLNGHLSALLPLRTTVDATAEDGYGYMITDRVREKVLSDNISYLKNTHKLYPPRTVRDSGGVSAAARWRLSGAGGSAEAQRRLDCGSAAARRRLDGSWAVARGSAAALGRRHLGGATAARRLGGSAARAAAAAPPARATGSCFDEEHEQVEGLEVRGAGGSPHPGPRGGSRPDEPAAREAGGVGGSRPASSDVAEK